MEDITDSEYHSQNFHMNFHDKSLSEQLKVMSVIVMSDKVGTK